jgi:hypothetical protein
MHGVGEAKDRQWSQERGSETIQGVGWIKTSQGVRGTS